MVVKTGPLHESSADIREVVGHCSYGSPGVVVGPGQRHDCPVRVDP